MLDMDEKDTIRRMVLVEAKSIRAVARETGRSRNTITKMLEDSEVPQYRRSREAILDELLPSLPADTTSSFAIIALAVAYGHLHLAQGKPEVLFAGLEERPRPFRKAGFIRMLADKFWLRGRADMALGRYDAARAALLQAREMAEAQEERAILWQILATSSSRVV